MVIYAYHAMLEVRVCVTMVRVCGLEPESVGAVGAKGWWSSETSVGADEHGCMGQ